MNETLSEQSNFLSGFGTGFIVLLVSDFGDNSFLALSIFALKHGAAYIFLPACVITVATQFVSVLIGKVLTLFISEILLHLASALFFIVFGGIMIYEVVTGVKILDSDSSESSDAEESPESKQLAKEAEEKHNRKKRHVWVKMFFILFVSEMGDRSQLATIALTATTNFWGIFLGGSLGLLVDTAIAIWLGGWMRNYVTEDTAGLIGGVIFIIMVVLTGIEVFF